MTAAFAAIYGLVGGSFAMALAWRLPREMNWWSARSQCPDCEHRLGFVDLIPIMSWLWQSGHCRHCAAVIPARYPLGEGLAAVVCAALAWRIGPFPELVLILMLVPLLQAAALIDLSHGYLPDGLTATIAALGLVAAVLGLSVTPAQGLTTALIAGALTLALRTSLGYALKREALGLGDVKLFISVGVWLEPSQLPWLILISAILGLAGHLLWRRRGGEAEMPFGPAIAAALLIILSVEIS